MSDMSEPSFRAKQIYEWLWQKSAHSFEEMTNLSLERRQLLEEHFTIHKLITDKIQRSSDGTIKFRFLLHDGQKIESVLSDFRKLIPFIKDDKIMYQELEATLQFVKTLNI